MSKRNRSYFFDVVGGGHGRPVTIVLMHCGENGKAVDGTGISFHASEANLTAMGNIIKIAKQFPNSPLGQDGIFKFDVIAGVYDLKIAHPATAIFESTGAVLTKDEMRALLQQFSNLCGILRTSKQYVYVDKVYRHV
jgi:hypothetical protein